MKRGGWARLVY